MREAQAAAEPCDLLRGLTSGGEDDFGLRFAAVADLVHADQTLWSLDALERRLVWMDTERVHSTLRSLRRSGWLELVGQEYRLSSDGLAVYATICRLGSLKSGRDDDLAMGVYDLEASTRLNEDVGPALRHLQHHLRRSIEDVEAAVNSQSELKVMEQRERLNKNLQWSQRARGLLDDINIEDDLGYRAGQRLGRDLGELHRWQSVMQRTLDDIGRTRIPMGAAGVRPADIARYLSKMETDDLVTLAQKTVSPPIWPLVMIADNLLNLAEFELAHAEAREIREIGWRDGVAASAEIGEPPPSEGELAYRRFDGDLDRLVIEGEVVPLDRFVLGGTFPLTCYRATLLALEDEMSAGRAQLEIDGAESREIYTDYLSEVSLGRVIPREVAA